MDGKDASWLVSCLWKDDGLVDPVWWEAKQEMDTLESVVLRPVDDHVDIKISDKDAVIKYWSHVPV